MSNYHTVHFDMAVADARPRTRSAANPARGASVGNMGPTPSRRPSLTPFARLAASRRDARALALPFSPVTLALALAITLGVAYIALIATVMSYATMTVGFTQSVRNDEAQVATLESQYLHEISAVTATNYTALGYEKPVAQYFVERTGVALR